MAREADEARVLILTRDIPRRFGGLQAFCQLISGLIDDARAAKRYATAMDGVKLFAKAIELSSQLQPEPNLAALSDDELNTALDQAYLARHPEALGANAPQTAQLDHEVSA